MAKGKGKGKGKGAGVRPPYDFAAATRPRELRTLVDDLIRAQVQPLQQQREAELARLAQEQAGRQQNIQGFSTALAGILQGAGEETSRIYQQAGMDTNAFAQGYSDTLASLGGPQAQAAGEVTRYLGGALPASTMQTTGAALGAAEAYQPVTAAGRGQLLAFEAGREGATASERARQEFGNLIAQAQAQRPQVMQDLRAFEAQKAQLRAGSEALKLQSEIAAAEITGFTPTGEPTLAGRTSLADALGIDPATGQLTPKGRAAIAAITGRDPVTGKPTAATAATQAERAAKLAKEKAAKKEAEEQKEEQRSAKADVWIARGQGLAADLLHPKPKKVVGEDRYGRPVETEEVPDPPSWEEARDQILSQIQGPLSRRGFSRTEILAMVLEILRSAGYPGEPTIGRPVVSP